MLSILKTLMAILIGSALVGVGYWWGAASQSSVPGPAPTRAVSDWPGTDNASAAAETTRALEIRSVPPDEIGTQRSQQTSSIASDQDRADEVGTSAANPEGPKLIGGEVSDAAPGNKIPIGDEAQKTLGSGKTAELHRKLEESGRDDSWSPYMEAQLRDYLSQKQGLSVFRFPVIECRNAGCEIQGVGYAENANQIWVNATADIYNQPWFEFKDMSTSVSQVGNSRDIVGMVIILLREPRDQTR